MTEDLLKKEFPSDLSLFFNSEQKKEKGNDLVANCWIRQSGVEQKEIIKLGVGGNKTISNVTDCVPSDAL